MTLNLVDRRHSVRRRFYLSKDCRIVAPGSDRTGRWTKENRQKKTDTQTWTQESLWMFPPSVSRTRTNTVIN